MGQKIRLFAFTAIIIFCIFITGCISNQISGGGGTLQLSSAPPGAEVYLDNQYRGSTPCTITDVTAGNHTLELRDDGYQSWSVTIAVTQGTYQLNATLTPLFQPSAQPTTVVSIPVPTPVPVIISPAKVTIQSDRNTMTVGSVITFSGTSTGTGSVTLMVYGPGYYANGVTVAQPAINTLGSWMYTWNPGNKITGGTYTMVVYDPQNTTSASTGFSVVGTGVVTIHENVVVISVGEPITFSGLCQTGSTNVILTLYGPGQYANGVVVSTPPVNADQTWSYTWSSQYALSSGQYTMTIQDAEKTQSASAQFTLNS